MNKSFLGDYPATIISYDKVGRTARVSIPSVTDGLEEGITATFAYPVGDDDKDTEREILAGAECYVFFLQGDPSSPVIWAYRSHGKGAVVDTRRIRQENIELLARADIKLVAGSDIDVMAGENVNISAGGEANIEGATVNINGELIINGQPYITHRHVGVQSGPSQTGVVAP